MITGKANKSGVIIRDGANYPDAKQIGFMPINSTFEGEIVSGLQSGAARDWVKLSKVNGVAAVGYIASWVVSIDPVYIPSPEPSIVPDSFTLTTSDGTRAEYKFVRML
jgi:hypothetical protein